MGKRGDGEGSITRRKDGLYMARYTVQTATGPKRKTLYGKTRGEVSEKLTKAMANRDGGLIFDAGKQTVGEYLARWLSNSVRGTVRQRTYERYESLVRVHLMPSIGRLKLKALTPDHVRKLYREKLDGGLAPRTVLHLHRTISKALKQAHDDGLIPRNAAASVKAPQPRRQEIRPLSREQVRTLLEAAGEAGEIGWKPCTSWRSPPGFGAASSWGLSGKTWTSTPVCSRYAARSRSQKAATSSRPPSPARAGAYGSRKGPRRPSESTASAS